MHPLMTTMTKKDRHKKPRRNRAFNLKKALRYVKRTLKKRQLTGLDHEGFVMQLKTQWIAMDKPNMMGAHCGRVNTANVRSGFWESENPGQPVPLELPESLQEKVEAVTNACGAEPSFWQYANWLLGATNVETDKIKQPINKWAEPNK